jgi:hypothetical protein
MEWRMNMHGSRKKKAGKIVLFLAIAVAALGKTVELLWNWLMPPIFGLTAITFWQALGLLALSWLLFGGLRGAHRPRWGRPAGPWREKMLARWEQMTPEERERFRAGIRGC